MGTALLERGLCCAKLGVEFIEVQKGGTGRCRLLPFDTLRVAVSDSDCELQLRHGLLTMLSALPWWVKEDALCMQLVEALSQKRRRRDPDYINSVAQCLQETRGRLDNCFNVDPALSPMTPRRVARPPTWQGTLAPAVIGSAGGGDCDNPFASDAPLESAGSDDQDGGHKRSREELEPAPRLLMELAKRVCPEAVADTDAHWPMHSLVATFEVAFDTMRRGMDGLRRELVAAQRQSSEIRNAAVGFIDLYDQQHEDQSDALVHLRYVVRTPTL